MFEFAFFTFALLCAGGIAGALFWGNLFKKVLCLSVFSNSIVMLYVLLGFYEGSSSPIVHSIVELPLKFANPLPSVLMLTAIVVGISVQAIAFALVIRVRKDYGTLEENEILEKIRLD